MVQMDSFSYSSSNGEDVICAVRWADDIKKPKAVLQIAHGIAEYIMRYDDFARFIAKKGVIVVGNDHLGHGKSAPMPENRGFFAENDGWNCAVRDIKMLHDVISAEYPDLPYIILGHSMGSFLTRTYIIDYPSDVDGCILSGTGNHRNLLCSAGIAAIKLAAMLQGKKGHARIVNNICFMIYNKRVKNPQTRLDWVSRDRDVVMQCLEDPDYGFSSTNCMLLDMFSGIKYITNEANVLKMCKNLPIYLFSGTEDPVGEYGNGVKRAYNMFLHAGMKDVEIKLYPGGRHEMLNEINKVKVYEDVFCWLEKKFGDLTGDEQMDTNTKIL